ncbi:MAG: hypothetical protein KGJ28_09765 [Alphaproteobacteria bacterium]|nr:hypothetical protein [Alphaproteobacteria bacterium]
MQLIHPRDDEALTCLRAMRSVTAGEGPLTPAVRAMMGAAQRLLMATDVDLDTLAPVAPDELARKIATPGLADQLVGALIVGVLAEGEPDPAAFARLEACAAALGVATPALRTVRLLVEREMLLCRLDFLRRSHVVDMVKDAYRHHGGILGAAAAMLGQRGLVEDKALAERFTALERLPAGTLGHAYFVHCRSHGFAFPGERGGFPISGAYHDMVHVLSGYGTAPEEELLVGGFTAGFKRSNPFSMILLVALLWGAGVNLLPVSQPHITGTLARDDNAEKFIRAIERGSRVNTDLSDNWDFWPVLPLPLEDARRRLGIMP